MAVKIVKSVARVVEILELFNSEQKPMPAVEIAAKLNYPLASTHEILKTLVECGYFTYGTPKWAFAPSSQLPDVVDWVRDAVTDDGVFQLMEALNASTRETINLSRRVSSQVKIIKGLECLYEIGVSSKPGTTMPVAQSLTGISSLAHLSDADCKSFLDELKRSEPKKLASENLEHVYDILSEIKRCGTAMRTDVSIEGIGAVCCPIISSNLSQNFVIGIVGPSARIFANADMHRRTLKRLTNKFGINTRYKIIN